MKALFLLLPICLLAACSEAPPSPEAPVHRASLERPSPAVSPDDSLFAAYWYRGEAELTSYTLEQARYGEIHPGKAVLIFVTEDVSRTKQVKLDRPEQAGDDRVKVLKLNLTKKFNTGIYPYSMMTSVFTPVYAREAPHTLKVTTTSQEWCGHTFTQFNLRDGAYRVELRSYFESEGDQDLTLERVWLEDEIWTRIRLNPDALPTGDVRIIPGTMYQRLAHRPLAVTTARATLTTLETGERAYTLTYPDDDRTLTIRFEPAFPYAITGWEETYRSGFGDRARRLTTRATRDRSMMLAYWQHNRRVDEALRAELNLD
ncbi:MAG: hypothetical protein KatS3mg042_0031 [Rhodothermaceae bacterium]|nr:MAG: hypothetical protein KatS3mg042_0031 [Rhodothermaceae bacterium]